MTCNWRIALLTGLAAAAILIAFLLPPITQNPAYHHFSDGRTILGIPNFWNVVSNAPFLLVALWGLRARSRFGDAWERSAYRILLLGVASVAIGSSYYHLDPSDARLFWDRLPMAIVFMTLLAITIGERIGSRTGRFWLLPLLAMGVGSLLLWRSTGDLRAYGLVQFYPMLALPLMLILFPPRPLPDGRATSRGSDCYPGSAGLWAMMAFYALAKALELLDQWVWRMAPPLSGHPWKHVAGAIAMLCYVQTMRGRDRPVRQAQCQSAGWGKPWRPSASAAAPQTETHTPAPVPALPGSDTR